MLHYHNHHHHQLNVHFLSRLIKCTDGCFPTASRQPTVSDSRDFSYSHSHSDAPISRIFRLVTIRSTVVYPWECRSEVLVAGCSSSHHSARIREEILESGNLDLQQWLNIRMPYTEADIQHRPYFLNWGFCISISPNFYLIENSRTTVG